MTRFATALGGIVLLLAACGPSQAPTSTAGSSAHMSSATPPAANTSADPTAHWKTYSSSTTHFSFRYKPSWNFADCNVVTHGQIGAGASWVVLDSNSAPEAGCGDGELPDAIMVIAEPDSYFSSSGIDTGGDVATGNFTAQSTETVSVAGVSGTRTEGKVLKQEGLQDPTGTTSVDYLFRHNGMGYEFLWMHFPGDTDTPADFDLMVKNTLKFAA